MKKQLVKSAYLALKNCLSSWLRIEGLDKDEEKQIREAYEFLSGIIVLIERNEADLEVLAQRLLAGKRTYTTEYETLKRNMMEKQITHPMAKQLLESYETLLKRIDAIRSIV